MNSTAYIGSGVIIMGVTCSCGSVLTARDDEELYGHIRRHIQTLHDEPARPTAGPARVPWPDAPSRSFLLGDQDRAEIAVVGTA